MKKGHITIILVAVLVLLAGFTYYYTTAKNVIEADESSPLDSLSEEERAEFDRQTNEMKDIVMEKDDSMNSQAQILAMGDFIRNVHAVSGKALLIEDSGNKIVRFENFETDNGPNLHIYLASDLDADDYIDLGEIKATKGNVNYEIPSGTDTGKYNKVLVWCVPFKVLFSYAELN